MSRRINMLKDQLRRRRAHDLGSYMDALRSATPTPAAFLMPAEFYKSLFASAVLHQHQQHHKQQSDVSSCYPQTPSPLSPIKAQGGMLSSSLSPPPTPHSHLSSNLLFSAVCVAAAESAKRSQLMPELEPQDTDIKVEQKPQLKRTMDEESSENVSEVYISVYWETYYKNEI